MTLTELWQSSKANPKRVKEAVPVSALQPIPRIHFPAYLGVKDLEIDDKVWVDNSANTKSGYSYYSGWGVIKNIDVRSKKIAVYFAGKGVVWFSPFNVYTHKPKLPSLYKRIKVKKPLTEQQRVKLEGRY